MPHVDTTAGCARGPGFYRALFSCCGASFYHSVHCSARRLRHGMESLFSRKLKMFLRANLEVETLPVLFSFIATRRQFTRRSLPLRLRGVYAGLSNAPEGRSVGRRLGSSFGLIQLLILRNANRGAVADLTWAFPGT